MNAPADHPPILKRLRRAVERSGPTVERYSSENTEDFLVSAEVVQLNPLHNLAIVAYDQALIGDTPVRSAKFSTEPLRAGDTVWVVGVKADHQLVHQETRVSSVDPLLLLPPCITQTPRAGS